MATRTIITLTDDLDGTPATQTVPFSVNGTRYEIDLSDKHAKQFRAAVTEFTSHARRQPATPARRARRGRQSRNQEIRSWALRHGHKISDRGRIAAEIVAKYEQAHRD